MKSVFVYTPAPRRVKPFLKTFLVYVSMGTINLCYFMLVIVPAGKFLPVWLLGYNNNKLDMRPAYADVEARAAQRVGTSTLLMHP